MAAPLAITNGKVRTTLLMIANVTRDRGGGGGAGNDGDCPDLGAHMRADLCKQRPPSCG